jgi:hypothetical protein
LDLVSTLKKAPGLVTLNSFSNILIKSTPLSASLKSRLLATLDSYPLLHRLVPHQTEREIQNMQISTVAVRGGLSDASQTNKTNKHGEKQFFLLIL